MTRCQLLEKNQALLKLLVTRIPKSQQKCPTFSFLLFYDLLCQNYFALQEKCKQYRNRPKVLKILTKSRWPDCVTNILAGFKSLCAIPLLWRYSKIPTSSAMINLDASIGGFVIFLRKLLSSPLSASSVNK